MQLGPPKYPSLLINVLYCHWKLKSCSLPRTESMFSIRDEIECFNEWRNLRRSINGLENQPVSQCPCFSRLFFVQIEVLKSRFFRISLTSYFLKSFGLLKTLDLHLGRNPFPFNSFRKSPIDLSPLCQLATCRSTKLPEPFHWHDSYAQLRNR